MSETLGGTDRLRLSWRVVNHDLHVGLEGERVVAALYTVRASTDDDGWLEFCCFLPGPPAHHEVLFGVGEGAATWWESRWDRGRAACEFVYFGSSEVPPDSGF